MSPICDYQAADSSDIMVPLSVRHGSSYVVKQAHPKAVFIAMAESVPSDGYTFNTTSGLFYSTTSETLKTDLKDIICTASGGGTDVSEPATLLLLGLGFLGMGVLKRR